MWIYIYTFMLLKKKKKKKKIQNKHLISERLLWEKNFFLILPKHFSTVATPKLIEVIF